MHYEFLPRDQTVNKECNQEVQCHLRESIQRKRSDLWRKKSWQMHHDNAPAIDFTVCEFLINNSTVMMLEPQYSPDLTPCGFFLFPEIKRTLKGHRFTSVVEVKYASLNKLKPNSKAVSRVGRNTGISV